jgi:hypothetical protein
MSQKTIFSSSQVIKNIQVGKGYSNAEAYAYAFGWVWAHLSEKDRQTFIAYTEEMLKKKTE